MPCYSSSGSASARESRSMASSSCPLMLPHFLLLLMGLGLSSWLQSPCSLIFVAAESVTATNFSFPSFTQAKIVGESNADHSSSDLLLIGDARLAEHKGARGGAFLQLSGAKPASAGGLIYKRPVQMVDLSSNMLVSFQSRFSLVLSPSDGDSVLFLLLSANMSTKDLRSCLEEHITANLCFSLAILFHMSDTGESYLRSRDGGVLIEASLHEDKTGSSCQLTSHENVGKILQTWIGYDSKRRALSIKMSDSDMDNSYTCSMVQNIDLTKIIGSKMYIGFFSANAKATHVNMLFSWFFQSSKILNFSDSYDRSTQHSIPVDPSRYEGLNSFEKDGGGYWGSVIVGLSCVASISLLASAVWLTFRRNSECDDAESVGIARCYVYQKLGTSHV